MSAGKLSMPLSDSENPSDAVAARVLEEIMQCRARDIIDGVEWEWHRDYPRVIPFDEIGGTTNAQDAVH